MKKKLLALLCGCMVMACLVGCGDVENTNNSAQTNADVTADSVVSNESDKTADVIVDSNQNEKVDNADTVAGNETEDSNLPEVEETTPAVEYKVTDMEYYYGKWELEGHAIEILENECILDDLKMAETYGELIWVPMYNYDYTTGETTDEVIGFKTEFPKNSMYNEDGTSNENYDLRFPGCSITFENEEGTFFYIYMFEETGPDEDGYLAWNRGKVGITGNATRVQ